MLPSARTLVISNFIDEGMVFGNPISYTTVTLVETEDKTRVRCAYQ
jgi:hypothetical protein